MDLRLYGGFGVRVGRLEKAGDATITHKHNFAHLTYLLGPAKVEALEPTNAEETEFRVVKQVERPKGGYVFIEAGKWHRLTALADGVEYHCIYVHRDPYGVCDEFADWQPAYE